MLICWIKLPDLPLCKRKIKQKNLTFGELSDAFTASAKYVLV